MEKLTDMKLSSLKVTICSAFFIVLCNTCEKNTGQSLSVTTGEITLFSEGIYIFSGSVSGTGSEIITEHGFCRGTSVNPVRDEGSICLGARSSDGSFSYTEFNVLVNTTYYVRAFATAGSGTVYGEERSFTTPEALVPKLLDIDQNIYYTVTIGSQVWMAENLKALRYSDGRSIPRVEDRLTWYNFAMYTRAYCWYDNYGAIGATYGALYTWPSAMDIDSREEIKPGRIQGVCPDGWHLPSDDEWKQLEMFLGMSRTDSDSEGWRGTDEGGNLKHNGSQPWQSPNTGADDESGFTALPSGWRDGAGYFKNMGTATRFWSSSIRGDYAWTRQLDYNSSQINRTTKGLYEGISVRCIKDN